MSLHWITVKCASHYPQGTLMEDQPILVKYPVSVSALKKSLQHLMILFQLQYKEILAWKTQYLQIVCTRFCLFWQDNYLQQEFPFTSVFYEVGDQARGEANDERATFWFFRMWTQEVWSQDIVCKQRIAAVTATKKTHLYSRENKGQERD